MQAERRTALAAPSFRDRARFFGVAAAVVAADQVTKLLIVRSIAEGDRVQIVDDVLVLSHVRNSGAAFGTLRGFGGLLALAAVCGIAVFAVVVWRRPGAAVGVAAALVAGGAMGNLIDRLARGTVVDFIDFRFWPAFNVADSAISVGAVLLVLFGFERKK